MQLFKLEQIKLNFKNPSVKSIQMILDGIPGPQRGDRERRPENHVYSLGGSLNTLLE